MQDPCPGAPAIATTMGATTRAHLDGGFDTAETWDEIAPGVRMAAGLAGEPMRGPVLVFLDCAAACEAIPARSVGTEAIVAPVTGSVDAAGTTLGQGDVRLEEPDVEQPPLVAGADGAQLVVIFADRSALRAALDDGTLAGPLGADSPRCSPSSTRSSRWPGPPRSWSGQPTISCSSPSQMGELGRSMKLRSSSSSSAAATAAASGSGAPPVMASMLSNHSSATPS